jgi:hypothetical protein
MNMKKLLESMQDIEECGMDEAPMPAPSMAPPPMPQNDGEPVRMNVNMSASGAEHVADLIDMMKNAGMNAAKPVDAKMLAPRLDMERLRGIVDEPGDEDPNEELEPVDEIDTEEGYANEPEEEFGDLSDAIPDGDDLNRKKKQFKAAQPGDNAMAMENIKSALYAALAEKKKPDTNKNGIPDYAEDGKGPNDLAKGKKGSKPKKGEVPPQFKKNVKEAEEAKKLPSAKDVKKMHDDGKSKQQIMAAYSGCDKAKMEKLYASSCSGH